jgi:hypothetical protein
MTVLSSVSMTVPWIAALLLPDLKEAPPGYGQFATGLVMALGGFAGVVHGFKLRARARLLAKTSLLPIAQANAGFVRLRGRIVCDRPLLSPFTATPCCFYQAKVKEPIDGGGASKAGWRLLHNETSSAIFRIQDNTGTIQISPQGAQIIALPTYRSTVNPGSTGDKEAALLDYVGQHCPGLADQFLFSAVQDKVSRSDDPQIQERLRVLQERRERAHLRETSKQSLAFEEVCFLPGQELEVAGMVEGTGAARTLQPGGSGEELLLSTATGNDLPLERARKAKSFLTVCAVIFLVGVMLALLSFRHM